MVKYSIKNKRKIPEAVLLSFPYPRVIFEETSPSILLSIIEEDFGCECNKVSQIQNVFLDLENNDIEKFESDDRLNFFLTKEEVSNIDYLNSSCSLKS